MVVMNTLQPRQRELEQKQRNVCSFILNTVALGHFLDNNSWASSQYKFHIVRLYYITQNLCSLILVNNIYILVNYIYNTMQVCQYFRHLVSACRNDSNGTLTNGCCPHF